MFSSFKPNSLAFFTFFVTLKKCLLRLFLLNDLSKNHFLAIVALVKVSIVSNDFEDIIKILFSAFISLNVSLRFFGFFGFGSVFAALGGPAGVPWTYAMLLSGVGHQI